MIPGEAIQVYCRPRPLPRDVRSCVEIEPEFVHLLDDSGRRSISHRYSHCFQQNASNLDVYTKTLKPRLDQFVRRQRCGALFAYGATGSGKTFTISGPPSTVQVEGILRLGLTDLWRLVSSPSCPFQLFLSFVEIYNENAFDLLVPAKQPQPTTTTTFRSPSRARTQTQTRPRLEIFDIGAFMEFRDVRTIAPTSESNLFELIESGLRERQVQATRENIGSSRSHSILTLRLRSPGTGSEARFHIVDMAGCESQAAKDRAGQDEGIQINLSLLEFGKVIRDLRDGCRPCFRNSKLTHFLQKVFTHEENSVSIISTIFPQLGRKHKVRCTLEFAAAASQAHPRPRINTRLQTPQVGRMRRNTNMNGEQMYSHSEVVQVLGDQKTFLQRGTEIAVWDAVKADRDQGLEKRKEERAWWREKVAAASDAVIDEILPRLSLLREDVCGKVREGAEEFSRCKVGVMGDLDTLRGEMESFVSLSMESLGSLGGELERLEGIRQRNGELCVEVENLRLGKEEMQREVENLRLGKEELQREREEMCAERETLRSDLSLRLDESRRMQEEHQAQQARLREVVQQDQDRQRRMLKLEEDHQVQIQEVRRKLEESQLEAKQRELLLFPPIFHLERNLIRPAMAPKKRTYSRSANARKNLTGSKRSRPVVPNAEMGLTPQPEKKRRRKNPQQGERKRKRKKKKSRIVTVK